MAVKDSIISVIDSLVSLWHKVLLYGLRPFYNVERENFIRNTFSKSYTQDEVETMLASAPSLVADEKQLRHIVKRMILNHTALVCLLTFVLSIPQKGWMPWLCIAIDFIQFQMFVFILTKKIVYCYEPTKNDNCDSDSEDVMFGADRSNTLIIRIKRLLASLFGITINYAIKTIARRWVVRLFAFNLAKSIAKFIGTTLSCEYFYIGYDCFVVLVTCVVCTFVSWILFAPMMQRFAHELAKKNNTNT